MVGHPMIDHQSVSSDHLQIPSNFDSSSVPLRYANSENFRSVTYFHQILWPFLIFAKFRFFLDLTETAFLTLIF